MIIISSHAEGFFWMAGSTPHWEPGVLDSERGFLWCLLPEIWLAALPSTNYCGGSFTNIMPWAAQWEDFQPFIAMRSVILQPISCQRCVMTYVWSHPFNPYPATFSVIFHCLKKWRCSLEYHGMRGFWSLQQQSAFFKVHVWVFNPNAPTHRDPLSIFMLEMSWTRKAKCLWTACSWHWTWLFDPTHFQHLWRDGKLCEQIWLYLTLSVYHQLPVLSL